MRYHELAIQRWLNGLFFVREGYPVPVVFTAPMDAFSHFTELWSATNNPFAYLYDAKDSAGTPLYQPHPAPARYPIISVHRKGWKYRTYQNFSIHRWRHINWPTESNAGPALGGVDAVGTDLTRCDLGNVTTSRMPMAWDFKFQIDFFCNRPDTLSFFTDRLFYEMYRTGGVPQTWIEVVYPGWFGRRLVRLYIDGDIESLTPEEPDEGENVQFRTSFQIALEGFHSDVNFEMYPAFWTLIFQQNAGGAIAPYFLNEAYRLLKTLDVRPGEENPTLNERLNVPSAGTCAEAILDLGSPEDQPVYPLGVTSTNSFGIFTVTQP